MSATLTAPPPPAVKPSPTPVRLSRVEHQILTVAVHSPPADVYCGDSPAMQRLLTLGLMRPSDLPPIDGEPLFAVTAAGRAVLESERVLTMYVIYERPTDFPDACVAVAWHVYSGQAVRGEVIAVAPTLEDVRDKLPPGLCRIPRSSEDDAVIVETWL